MSHDPHPPVAASSLEQTDQPPAARPADGPGSRSLTDWLQDAWAPYRVLAAVAVVA